MEPEPTRTRCEQIAAAAIAAAAAIGDDRSPTEALEALAPVQHLLTDVQRALVVAALEDGTTVRATARAAGRTTATVQQWRKDAEKEQTKQSP